MHLVTGWGGEEVCERRSARYRVGRLRHHHGGGAFSAECHHAQYGGLRARHVAGSSCVAPSARRDPPRDPPRHPAPIPRTPIRFSAAAFRFQHMHVRWLRRCLWR
jgi:hypothetical protein